MSSASDSTTLEWFGATTFRLKTKGLTIFLDTWLDRPSILPHYLSVDDVSEADYIFISHAHFDHLPGADRIAKRTGAHVIANAEAINVLAKAGVPEDQLYRVAGGERVPLFTKAVRDQAKSGKCEVAGASPGAPPLPHPSLAVAAAHIWPSLHCLMPGGPGEHPEVIDTGSTYTGEAHPYFCTMDMTRGMKYGLLKVGDLMPREHMNAGFKSFADYVSDEKNVFSYYDGGQLMVNFVVDGKAILWNAHLGAFEGVMRNLEPKPDVAILGIAGRANSNGRPWDGSAAEFALKEVQWLGEPKSVVWCLHDESPIPPYRIDTKAATQAVEEKSKSKVLTFEHVKAYDLDI